MDIREQNSFFVGEWCVTPDQDVITRDGRTEHLEPLAMQVLIYLASRAGEVVPRSDLEQAVWKGAVVSYDSVTSTVIKLRKALGDDARNPSYIATIPKRGYRLIARVHTATDVPPAREVRTEHRKPGPEAHGVNAPTHNIAQSPTDPPNTTKRSPVAMAWILGAGFLAVLFYLLLQHVPERSEYTQAKPGKNPVTIAVLPFINIGNDPDRNYLSDGISQDLLTGLARLDDITVIAQHSSFTHRDRSPGMAEIGRDLGVQYLLDGSVQIEGNGLRVSAQLIEVENGRQLWADRFDKELDDVFDMQDEITREVTSALAVQLDSSGSQPPVNRHPASFAAYDLFLRGQRVSAEFSREAIIEAIELYREAIKLDPGYAHAYAALGVARIREFLFGFSETPVMASNRALQLALKAEEMDPSSHQVQWSLGYIHMYRREFQKSEAASIRAIELSPSYADGYSLLALVKNNMGLAAEAIPLIEQAMRLNPHYTWDYVYQLGRAYYTLGEHEKAIDYLTEAIERNEATGYPRLFLAAAYVNLGQIDDAEWEIEQLDAYRPEYASRAYLKKTMPIGDPDLLIQLLDDLSKAGLPE